MKSAESASKYHGFLYLSGYHALLFQHQLLSSVEYRTDGPQTENIHYLIPADSCIAASPHQTVSVIDAAGLGRPLLTDPDYVNKLKCGNAEGARGSCAVNPECGREWFVGIRPAERAKKVAVVGGGPAGMEAARVSALRGYSVTLFESFDCGLPNKQIPQPAEILHFTAPSFIP